MNYYLAAFVAFIGYVLYKWYIYPLYLSPLRKIPGPPVDNFILGHYVSLSKKEGETLAHVTKQYGGIVRVHNILNKPNIFITDPKLIQKILVNRSYDFPKYFFDSASVKKILGDGVVFADGEVHKRQRKVVIPTFAFANIKEMVPIFAQAGHKLKDIWMKQIGNKKEERISITAIISRITLDVIGLVGFNYEFNAATSDSELVRAYNSILNVDPPILYLALTDLFPFIRNILHFKSFNIFLNVAERIVAEQTNTSRKNLLSFLIKTNKNLPVDEQLTHDEVVGQVMTFLVAGHESTSASLNWVLYFLAKNPDIQDRLRKEVLDAFIDSNYFPTFDKIEQMKYLDCVFKETLRIAPPAPSVTRYTLKDEIMNGYVIPKNTILKIPIYAIHHDPSIWGDDANHFNPSRWLDPEIKSKVSSNNFIPFSAGPKSCLGTKFAQLEFKSILSIIIRNFKLKLVEGFTFEMKSTNLTKPFPGIDLRISKIDY